MKTSFEDPTWQLDNNLTAVSWPPLWLGAYLERLMGQIGTYEDCGMVGFLFNFKFVFIFSLRASGSMHLVAT